MLIGGLLCLGFILPADVEEFLKTADMHEIQHFVVSSVHFLQPYSRVVSQNVERNASGKKWKLSCCKCIFDQIKTNMTEIQPENYQNVKKTHFWQKGPGVNGLNNHIANKQTKTAQLLYSQLSILLDE